MDASASEELFDIVDARTGHPTGEVRARSAVHAQGLYHAAVHTWLLAPDGRLLLQQRAACKDSWPGRWDVSSAGHISAGEAALPSAVRELAEELGLGFPPARFELLFVHLEQQASVQKGRAFINNEFNHVYLVTLSAEEAAELQPGSPAFALQASEVSDVRWLPWREVQRLYEAADACIVPSGDLASYSRLFSTLQSRGL
jgi:isopentenyldiphosphate isomerase